jgi:acyl carrier protein
MVELDDKELTLDSPLDSLGWDSLTSLTFISKVDELLGASVDADLLSRAVTVRDLFQFVTS